MMYEVGRNYVMPNYDLAVRTVHGRRILEVLGRLGGEADFKQIEEETGVKHDVLKYYLENEGSDLRRSNVVVKMGDRYRLKHKTTFCWLHGGDIPFTYIGMLGLREDNPEPEPKTFLNLILEERGEIGHRRMDRESGYVLTTSRALEEWGSEVESLGIGRERFIECSQYEIQDIERMKEKVLSLLCRDEMRDRIVILDCTGLTKPATIAFYEVARDFYFPLVYVYVKTKKLKWLISREYVRERLFMGRGERGPYDKMLEKLYKSERVPRDLIRILNFLGEKCGIAGFNEIGRSLGYIRYRRKGEGKVKMAKAEMIKKRLAELMETGLVEQVRDKGPYKLKYKTPFCWINKNTEDTEYAYFGLLGDKKRAGWEIETKTALSLLQEDGIEPTYIITLTTPSGYEAWDEELKKLREECKLKRFHPYTCHKDFVDDFNSMKEFMEPIIQEWLERYVVICDCTGLTKPATLALYEIARTYYAPLIYLYGHGVERRLHWLIEKESVKKRFGSAE
jgi:hypothetical protein